MSHYKPFDRIRNQIKRKYKYKETNDLNLCQKVLITYQDEAQTKSYLISHKTFKEEILDKNNNELYDNFILDYLKNTLDPEFNYQTPNVRWFYFLY